MADSINYIPPQMDPLASTSTRAARQDPLRLLMQDASVLFTMLPYMPHIFLPFKANDKSAELYLNIANLRDIFLQCWLCVIETTLLVLAVPAFFILPGIVSVVAAALCGTVINLLTRPIQGPKIVHSNMDEEAMALAKSHKDERWLFVNGVATVHAGLQKNVDRISRTFGRAVIGIHNVTYGLPADLLECLIQRCLAFQSMDVRVTYAYVKAILMDPTVTKVVLIGHSQGGIIVSLALDHLLSELPASCMSKLEIYTFGSAASHFCNPLLSLPTRPTDAKSSTNRTEINLSDNNDPKHLIPHIEHYANELDMIPRWGVLHSVCDILENRYAGSVFVRIGASGHLFNQHYMDSMFPLPKKDTTNLLDSFLDRVVKVDKKLSFNRDQTAFKDVRIMRRESESELRFGNGEEIPVETPLMVPDRNLEGGVMTFARTDSGRLMAEQAEGKSVRELSRLWMYQGGFSPEDHDPECRAVASEGMWLSGKEGNGPVV